MDPKAIIALNWMAFMLLAPAAIILAWKMVSEKFKGRVLSSHQITGSLLLVSAVIGVAVLNTQGRVRWLSLTLFAAQSILLVFLFKRLWSPLKRKLRG